MVGLESIAVYPFERLQKLFAGVTHPDPIDCTIGEPQHAPPQFVLDAHNEAVAKYAGSYPKTRQIPQLTEAIAGYAQRNLGVSLSENNILALCGSGEGLFSMPMFAKNRSGKNTVVLQTPSYKPYEGAADLAGMRTEFEALTAEHDYQPLFEPFVRGDVQNDAALMFINYPNNPCGANASRATLEKAIALAQEHDFILASDECYIDIYRCPTDFYMGERSFSALHVAQHMGIKDFHNVLVFNSLSKRSSLPGMRSGFMAGDPKLIEQYMRMRMLERKVMPTYIQVASAAAWSDDRHAEENRVLYEEKLHDFGNTVDRRHYKLSDGTFFIWFTAPEGFSGESFAKELYVKTGVKTLPGAYLCTPKHANPEAEQHVRIALVHDVERQREAARRIQSFIGGVGQ